MPSINFCCGTYKLEGWENYDREHDIEKPLGFPNEYANFIFIEHGIEHVSQTKGFEFIEECYRILKIGGVLRIAWPDVTKILKDESGIINEHMRRSLKLKSCSSVGSARIAMFHWGHKSFWDCSLMETAMTVAGFKVSRKAVGESDYDALKGVECHGKDRVDGSNALICSVVEGVKL